MRSVTQGQVARLPATTEGYHAIFFSDMFYRCELTALMTTIAKRLVGTLATGTPEIALSCLKLNAVGANLC